MVVVEHVDSHEGAGGRGTVGVADQHIDLPARQQWGDGLAGQLKYFLLCYFLPEEELVSVVTCNNHTDQDGG